MQNKIQPKKKRLKLGTNFQISHGYRNQHWSRRRSKLQKLETDKNGGQNKANS